MLLPFAKFLSFALSTHTFVDSFVKSCRFELVTDTGLHLRKVLLMSRMPSSNSTVLCHWLTSSCCRHLPILFRLRFQHTGSWINLSRAAGLNSSLTLASISEKFCWCQFPVDCSWILPFYFLPFHSNLFASCNLCLFKECWKVSALKTMRSNTKACQYKSITQFNLSQQDLVLECLEGLRFFYIAGSSSGQGPGRGWHCLYSRLLIWHHEAADYCSSTEVPKML